jgi:hypothetical protein
MVRKLIIQILLLTFGFTCIGPVPQAHAQTMLLLPAPGQMIQPSEIFKPLQLRGIQMDAHNPLQFDFLVDKGNSGLHGQVLKDEITTMSKYFLTCLTVPEKDLWVNLSPYEKDRIAPESFGVTEMGKALLEQDYLLKQIMASLSYPENQLGKEFWKKVYQEANQRYGRTDIPVNAFTKVWIVPKTAEVYVKGNGAFVVNSKLEVMLETDYKAFAHNKERLGSAGQENEYGRLFAQIVREVILPQLRQEINEGKNFGRVRQVYNAMILATWYKRHLKDSLLGKAYIGKNKVMGVDADDKDIKEKIFQQYLKAYKKCVYNYVRDDFDPLTQTVTPRKYTSGGIDYAMFGLQGDMAYSETYKLEGMSLGNDLAMATINVAAATGDGKIIEFPDTRLLESQHPFKQVAREVIEEDVQTLEQMDNAMANAVSMPTAFLGEDATAPQRTLTAEVLYHYLIYRMGAGERLGGTEGNSIRIGIREIAQAIFKLSPSAPVPQDVIRKLAYYEYQVRLAEHGKIDGIGLAGDEKGDWFNVEHAVEEFRETYLQTQKPVSNPAPSRADALSRQLMGSIGRGNGNGNGQEAMDKKPTSKFSDRPIVESTSSSATRDTSKELFNVVNDFKPAMPTPEELAWVNAGSPVAVKQRPIQEKSKVGKPTAKGWAARVISGVRKYLRLTDVVGVGTGVAVTALTAGLNAQTLGMAALLSLAATRLFYAGKLFLHEQAHNLIALIQAKGNFKKAYSGNLMGGYTWKDWLGVLLAPHPKKDAGVELAFLSKGQRRFNQIAGFTTSVGVAGLSVWLALKFGLPKYLLGALGAATLKILAGSFKEDILHPSAQGKIKCGNSGVMWMSDDDDFFPEFSQEALVQMRYIAELRGDQGEGIFTWGKTEEGDIIPLIYKIMKTKRGSPVIFMTHLGFKKELQKAKANGINPVGKIKIVSVHDRFATQGKPTEKALHTHLGPIERRTIVGFKDGQDIVAQRTIVTAATENGDNNFHMKHNAKVPVNPVVRSLYPRLLHMEKNVFIEPNSANPKGSYDYLPPGDAPALAVQLQWYDNQGDTTAASRFSYYEVMNDSIEEMEAHILAVGDEEAMGESILDYYQANKQFILRPQLKKADKSFQDLWVTKDMVQQYPQLKFQYEALENFRRGLEKHLLAEMSQRSQVGRMLDEWRSRHSVDFKQRLTKFVNMTVERFFTANRLSATQQVAEASRDSFYGVTVRNSKEPESMTIWTDGQSVSLGLAKGYVVWNSEHRAIIAQADADNPVQEVLFLNSESPGQLTDIAFNQDTGKPDLTVYDFQQKRFLEFAEIKEMRMQLHGNQYATSNVQRDPETQADQDINDIPKTIKASRADWKNKKSFNRQTVVDFSSQFVSRGIEIYIRQNSTFYKTARGQMLELLYRQAQRCQTAQCSAEEAYRRRSLLISAVENDKRVLGYLQSLLDNLISYEADVFAADLMAGRKSDLDLYPLVLRLNQELPQMLEGEMKELADNLIKNNRDYLKNWAAQQQEMDDVQQQARQERLLQDENKNGDRTSPNGAGQGLPEQPSMGSGEADMYAAAIANSLWLGSENLKDMMTSIWPKMVFETNSANKSADLEPGDRHKVGKRTLAYVVSKSGATSATKNLMGRLKKIMGDRLYICTGDVDTVMGLSIGQRYYKGAPFTKRIFVTGHTYNSEVDSTGDVEMAINQIEMVIHLAKRWSQLFPHVRLWGFNFSKEMIQRLEERRDIMVEKAKLLTGVKEDGITKIESAEHNSISKSAKVFGHMLGETFKTNIISRIAIFGMGFGLTALAAKWGLQGISAYVASAVETSLALLVPLLITTLFYRPLTGMAEKWGWLGPRGVVFGDIPALSQVAAVSARIWGGLALGSMKFKYFAANAQDHYAFRHLPDVIPGTVQIFGVPDDPHERELVLLTAGQSNVRYARLGFISTWPVVRNISWLANWFKKSFIAGPEIFTVGHGEVNPDLTNHHINMGPVEFQPVRPEMSDEEKQAIGRMNRFYARSFEVVDRLIAYHVFLKESYEQARHLGWWEIFKQGTLSKVKIFNTPSPVGGSKNGFPHYRDENKAYGKPSQALESPESELVGAVDHAALAENPSEKGGIDMNSDLLELTTTGNDNGTSNMDQGMLKVPIAGMIPQVSHIVPVTSGMLQSILGQEP